MTREMPLTQGYVAIVDDADWELACKHFWQIRKSGHLRYAQTVIYSAGTQRVIKMHRVIMGAGAGQIVDHIDGNGLNNTRANLRFVTPSESMMNTRKRQNCTSQFKGVYWSTERQCWRVEMHKNYKKITLGSFANELDAARAYDTAARKHFGEYAHLNFPTQIGA